MGTWAKNPTEKGWLTSILELGAWLGTIYSGFLAEILSRKYAIIVNTIIFIIGVVIQTTAVVSNAGHNEILAGRFITGTSGEIAVLSLLVLTIYRYGCR